MGAERKAAGRPSAEASGIQVSGSDSLAPRGHVGRPTCGSAKGVSLAPHPQEEPVRLAFVIIVKSINFQTETPQDKNYV